jgi:hypothetical protein
MGFVWVNIGTYRHIITFIGAGFKEMPMAKRRDNRFRRSALFVVWVWRINSRDPLDPAADAAGSGMQGGHIQRAINGAGRDFAGWPALIEAVEALLAAAQPLTIDRSADGKDSGNSARE